MLNVLRLLLSPVTSYACSEWWMHVCVCIDIEKIMHTVLPWETLIFLGEVCCSYYIKIPKSSPTFVVSKKDRRVQVKGMMKDIIVVLEWVVEVVWMNVWGWTGWMFGILGGGIVWATGGGGVATTDWRNIFRIVGGGCFLCMI